VPEVIPDPGFPVVQPWHPRSLEQLFIPVPVEIVVVELHEHNKNKQSIDDWLAPSFGSSRLAARIINC